MQPATSRQQRIQLKFRDPGDVRWIPANTEPNRGIDTFRLREIEQQLAGDIQLARTNLTTATAEDERQKASEVLQIALNRFTDFAARKIVPEEFLPRPELR
jgi:hypothetical protein